MIFLLVVLVGLSLGSFINALVWRLHEDKDFLSGRSECIHCKHQLAPNDLIPVLSWLVLKGKCRYCKKPISVQYPLVELITAIAFVVSYLYWPFELSGLVGWLIFIDWLLALVLMIALSVYDLRWMLLPNKLIYPLISLGAVFRLLVALNSSDFSAALVDGLLGTALLWGFFAGLYYLSKGRWIGYGDVRYSVFAGLVLGLGKGLLALVLAFNVAALVVLPLLILKVITRKQPVPFGPFLIFATYVSLLFGDQLIKWYVDTFLYGGF